MKRIAVGLVLGPVIVLAGSTARPSNGAPSQTVVPPGEAATIHYRVNNIVVETLGIHEGFNYPQFGLYGMDLAYGPLIVNNPAAYGWNQTASTVVINHNQKLDYGCADGSWGDNFAGRGLYPAADQVALCELVNAGTPVATYSRKGPNPAFKFTTISTPYVRWLYFDGSTPRCPNNTDPISFRPDGRLLNEPVQPVCPLPQPALSTRLVFSPRLARGIVAQLRPNMVIGTSNNARGAIVGWASDGSSIDVDSWVFSGNPVLIGYDPTAYGDGAQTIVIGINNTTEGHNVVLTVPAGAVDPGTGLAPNGIGYELDFLNDAQPHQVNPFLPSSGSPKQIGALNSCSGRYKCDVGSLYSGPWQVGYNITAGSGLIAGFLVDSTAAKAGVGFWDQLGGNTLSYGYQQTVGTTTETSDVVLGLSRMGEIQSGFGGHKTFRWTSKLFTTNAAAEPFTIDGTGKLTEKNLPIYTKYWPRNSSASLFRAHITCTDGNGNAGFYDITTGLSVDAAGNIKQSTGGPFVPATSIGTVAGWLLTVQQDGHQIYPVFSGGGHVGCTADLELGIAVSAP